MEFTEFTLMVVHTPCHM